MAGGRAGALLLGSDFKALGAVRSLARRGIPTALVDNDPRSAWYSRYPLGQHLWTDRMDSPRIVDFLVRLSTDRGYLGWMLFPMQDDAVELVSHFTSELGRSFRLTTPEWSVLQRVQDKRFAHEMADRVGVSRPRTFYPANADDLLRLDVEYPAIIKPSLSMPMQRALHCKALVVHDQAELAAMYRLAADSVPAELIMVQELIPGDGRTQFSVAAFCERGEMVAGMAARRTRQFPYDFGMSSSFVETVDRPDLLQQASRLLRDAGLSGMVEVEFKHDARDGSDKLLDINVRPWGWHQLCIAAGLDFPYLQYCLTMKEPLPPVAPTNGYAWRRMLTDVPAAMQEIRAGVTSPALYLRSYLRRRTVRSVWDLRDPLPALVDPTVTVIRMTEPRLRAWWKARPKNRGRMLPEPFVNPAGAVQAGLVNPAGLLQEELVSPPGILPDTLTPSGIQEG
jgi:D-aspartate ligase